MEHDVDAAADFGAVDVGSAVGGVVYAATAGSVVNVAARYGSAGRSMCFYALSYQLESD